MPIEQSRTATAAVMTATTVREGVTILLLCQHCVERRLEATYLIVDNLGSCKSYRKGVSGPKKLPNSGMFDGVKMYLVIL